jgi:hypothetical protein
MATFEAGYISCSDGFCEVKWQHQVQCDLCTKDGFLLMINCDNHGALSHITSTILFAQTHPTAIYYYNCPEFHAQYIVDYYWIHTNQNIRAIPAKVITDNMYQKPTKAIRLLYEKSICCSIYGWFTVLYVHSFLYCELCSGYSCTLPLPSIAEFEQGYYGN